MSTEAENLALVKSAYTSYFSGDIDGFFSVFDEHVELHEADSLPYGGTYKGIEHVKKGISKMFNAWDGLEFKIEEFTAGGELVIVYMQLLASGKTTGKTFSFPVAEIWRIRNSKVVEIRPIYWDTAKAQQVFGA
jgi:hypothetical protein